MYERILVGTDGSKTAAKAVDRAMILFWRKGYEGTSLSDLTGGLGITRPSLYAAFGSKQGLFRKVLERYVEVPSRYVTDALKAPSAREVAERELAPPREETLHGPPVHRAG